MRRKISATLEERDAISRAELFLLLAEDCAADQRELFEAFLEASIVFGRAALHRLQSEIEQHSHGKGWLKSLPFDEALKFFYDQRNYILKKGPPKVGQIISFAPVAAASELYYFETYDVPATDTVRRHLQSIATCVEEAKIKFVAQSHQEQ